MPLSSGAGVSLCDEGDGGSLVRVGVKRSEIAPVKPSKSVGQHECHDQNPEPQDNRVPRLPQLEPANAGHQHVTHDQIKHSPQDVDQRR